MFGGFCEVECSICKTILIRRNGWVIENAKLGLKTYCSPECFSKGRMTGRVIKCENPKCKKSFYRIPSAMAPHNFCSQSCSATVSNHRRKKEKPPHIPIPRAPSKYTKESIIHAIQAFSSEHGRIPVKRELNPQYRMARILFGNWNNAIKAAGFRPNKVMFSRRYTANDGHVCDSFAEMIIDDWFSERNIEHHIHVPYFHKNMSADFSVGNILIEYFGLSGELYKYDTHVAEKKKLWKQRNLFVIEIYPKDLFPVNTLTEIFRNVL